VEDSVTRIVAGSAGGRRLRTPDGDRTRPTSDRVREAMFSTVESLLGTWEGVHVLDLYAGSGALGLEALSRGAARALMVESHRRTAGLISGNARDLGLTGAEVSARTVQLQVERRRADDETPFDLVFADPPYATPSAELEAVLAALVAGSWLGESAVVVLERARRSDAIAWPDGLEPIRRRPYGETVLWYGRRCDARSQQGPD